MLISPSRVAAASLKVLPRKSLSRVIGLAARVPSPQPVLRVAMQAYCNAYGIDLSQYEVPTEGFGSFDAFFTRQLKAGARPLDVDEDALLSPADGRLEDLGPILPGSTLRVKGRTYRVGELLGDERAATLYAGGVFAIVYLSPRDYHRVHAPVDGPVRLLRHVPGTLFPVNEIGLRHIPNLFARNERVVVEQASERHGPITTIMVGAIGVGRISVSFHDLITNDGKRGALAGGELMYGDTNGPQLARGAELGTFHLGSTAIIMAGPRAGLSFVKRAGEQVRYGEALLRKIESRKPARANGSTNGA